MERRYVDFSNEYFSKRLFFNVPTYTITREADYGYTYPDEIEFSENQTITFNNTNYYDVKVSFEVVVGDRVIHKTIRRDVGSNSTKDISFSVFQYNEVQFLNAGTFDIKIRCKVESNTGGLVEYLNGTQNLGTLSVYDLVYKNLRVQDTIVYLVAGSSLNLNPTVRVDRYKYLANTKYDTQVITGYTQYPANNTTVPSLATLSVRFSWNGINAKKIYNIDIPTFEFVGTVKTNYSIWEDFINPTAVKESWHSILDTTTPVNINNFSGFTKGQIGSQTITCSFVDSFGVNRTISYTINVTVSPEDIDYIEILGAEYEEAVTKITVYDYGDVIDFTNYKVMVHYIGGTSEVKDIDWTICSCTKKDLPITQRDSNTIFNYYDKQCTLITTYYRKFKNFNVSVAENIYSGDTLEDKITAEIVFNNYDLGEDFTVELDPISDYIDFDLEEELETGTYNFELDYQGFLYNGTFEVKENVITSISFGSETLNLIEHHTLDLITDAPITVHRANGTTQTKVYGDAGLTYNFADGTEILLQDNGKTFTATYNTFTCSATLLVSAMTISSISVETQPESQEVGDKLELTGLTIKATYNSGYSEIISDLNLLTFTPSRGSTITTSTNAVTVSYLGKQTTVSLTNTLPDFESLTFDISRISQPIVDGSTFSYDDIYAVFTYHNGYELKQLLGNVLSITLGQTTLGSGWSDGSAIDCDFYGKNNYITFNLFDPLHNELKTAKCYLTIVSNKVIQTVTLSINSESQIYVRGQEFTGAGITVNVKDSDNEIYQVDDYEISPAIGTLLTQSGKVSVVVSVTDAYGNIVSDDADIYVKSILENENTFVEDFTIATNIYSINRPEQAEPIVFTKTTDEYGVTSEKRPLFSVDLVNSNGEYTGSSKNTDCIGYIDFGAYDSLGNMVKTGSLVLFEDYTSPTNDMNIEIKYPHYVSGLADNINKATTGIVFDKHLFVATKENNRDDHSDFDFTYFSEYDRQYYGSDETKIVGYDIFRDGTLLVFKESSNHEATMFVRNSSLVNATSYDGTQIDGAYEYQYPCFDVNSNGGEGALMVANFVGDTIILTRNGLKVVASKETTYNNAKYTADVSSAINEKILKENIEFIKTHKERLFVKTDRGIYIGEYSVRDENTNQYEWYFIDNVNADIFFDIDDKLYFGNQSGEIFDFHDEFRDYKKIFISNGSLTISGDIMSVNSDVYENVAVNDLVKIKHTSGVVYNQLSRAITRQAFKNIYGLNADENADNGYYSFFIEGNKLVVKGNGINRAYSRQVFSDSKTILIQSDETTGESGLEQNVYYEMRLSPDSHGIDFEYNLYKDNELVSLENDVRFTIFEEIENVIVGEKLANNRIRIVKNNNDILNIQPYTQTLGQYSAEIRTKRNVISYAVTKPIDMGNLPMSKTIWSWTIANDTDLGSEMDVGFISDRRQGGYTMVVKTVSGSRQIDLGNMNFNRIQFTNDKLPHLYVRKRTLSDIGFIRFIYKNDSNSNMVMGILKIIYQINSLNREVK